MAWAAGLPGTEVAVQGKYIPACPAHEKTSEELI